MTNLKYDIAQWGRCEDVMSHLYYLKLINETTRAYVFRCVRRDPKLVLFEYYGTPEEWYADQIIDPKPKITKTF